MVCWRRRRSFDQQGDSIELTCRRSVGRPGQRNRCGRYLVLNWTRWGIVRRLEPGSKCSRAGRLGGLKTKAEIQTLTLKSNSVKQTARFSIFCQSLWKRCVLTTLPRMVRIASLSCLRLTNYLVQRRSGPDLPASQLSFPIHVLS